MTRASIQHAVFVALVLVLVALAFVPILASDLFRQPYHSLWPTINRTLARLRIDYNPPGGGIPPRYPSWRDPADAFLFYRELTLTTDDGVDLDAWYVPARAAGAPTVLLTHGLLGNKWLFLRLVPGYDAGYNVLLFDFRGHGESADRPTTVGRLEVMDVQAALDWLEEEGVGNRVAGLGTSLGAVALVNTAVRDDRLDVLILDSMFADWSDVDYAENYRLPPEWLVPDVPTPEELLPQIQVPVLIIHGTADLLTNVDHAYRVYDAANEPKQLWINDSGHAWSAWTYPDIFEARVLDLLERAFAEQE